MATITPQITTATSTDVDPSINWRRAMAPGPDIRVKITEEYAKLVARDAYFWAWPLVNIYNRRLVMAQVKEAVKAGPVVFAPLNRNAMFTDYVDPAERAVACPNQDVVLDNESAKSLGLMKILSDRISENAFRSAHCIQK